MKSTNGIQRLKWAGKYDVLVNCMRMLMSIDILPLRDWSIIFSYGFSFINSILFIIQLNGLSVKISGLIKLCMLPLDRLSSHSYYYYTYIFGLKWQKRHSIFCALIKLKTLSKIILEDPCIKYSTNDIHRMQLCHSVN